MAIAHEYLTFILKNEEYGIDILCVQEIRRWSSVTELPNKPNYFKGVINLRGTVIPIVDLRQRFGIPPLEYTEKTVNIILRSRDTTRPMVVGLIVDAVSEVYKFTEQQICEPPLLGNKLDNGFLQGLVSMDSKNIILLNTKTLLNQDDLYNFEPELMAQ